MPKVWHCHKCQGGPYNPEIIAQCIDCEHKKCSKCKVEQTHPQDHTGYHINYSILPAVVAPRSLRTTHASYLTHGLPSQSSYYAYAQPVDGEKKKEKPKYAWQCCYCHKSLNNISIDAYCSHGCGHPRCAMCPLVRIKS
ncbi:hypothetical protein M011DRAFT_222718 [Sporormia fimetaria CBS 119925]|uniref:Uncharacterized protein n=1 Tax=Sporormia fimetaria CBS 119925 TaxID=1340428 RepID=A0A6A6UZV8_9PLEO|nr:hypothetical protein M011DRAFT_222718 [Sporormia fimetaria CBS 119925]